LYAVWRTTPSELDFCSVDALLASLRQKPPRKLLELVRKAEDFDALVQLAAREEIRGLARGREAVLCCGVCRSRLRKLLLDGHVDVWRLPAAGQPGAASTPSGPPHRSSHDIDGTSTLMTRIAFVRTGPTQQPSRVDRRRRALKRTRASRSPQ
jgi:ATP-dependent RNA helicase SUPV3L1/SUV3